MVGEAILTGSEKSSLRIEHARSTDMCTHACMHPTSHKGHSVSNHASHVFPPMFQITVIMFPAQNLIAY